MGKKGKKRGKRTRGWGRPLGGKWGKGAKRGREKEKERGEGRGKGKRDGSLPPQYVNRSDTTANNK